MYRFKVVCGTDTTISNIVKFKTEFVYCEPNFLQASQGPYIENVITTGGTVNLNNTGTGYGLNTNGYSDYLDQELKVVQGFNLEYNVKLGNYPQALGLVIAIDTNQNGQFELGEAFVNSQLPIQQTYTGTFLLNSLAPGTYRMRVMVTGTWANSLCTIQDYGEAEDYLIEIIPATACSGTPNAGTVTVTPSSASPQSTYNVTALGYAMNSGLSYIWETSTDGSTWTAFGNPTSYYVPLTQIAPDNLNDEVKWRLKVSCGTDTETSNVATFTTLPIYCTPSAFYATDYTSDFHTTGATTNINYTATAQTGTNGYNDLTADASQVITQVAGQSFDFSHTHHNSKNILAIWIDWNKNGTFELAERVFYGYNKPITQQGTIAIPMNITPGDYRMRVRVHRNPLGIGVMDLSPCSIEPYGQTLDFKLTVTPMSDCSGTPSAGTITLSETTANAGSIYQVSASGYTPSAGLTFTWEKSTDEGTTWNPFGDPSSFYVPLIDTAQNPVGSTAKYRLIVACGTDSHTSNEITFTTQKVYCTPPPISSLDSDYLTQFITTGGITNAQYVAISHTGVDGYNDMTDSTLQLISHYPGQQINFSASYHPVMLPPNFNFGMWIDWNDNGTFEEMEQLSDPIYGPNPRTGAITIPITAQAGVYRMRLRSTWTSALEGPNGACNNLGWGQTLDFKIEVLPCDTNVSAGTIEQGDTSICQYGTIVLSATETGGTWMSEHPSIAGVDQNTGIVSGLTPGDAKIVYSIADANGCSVSTSVIVTVVESVPVTFSATPKLGEVQDTLSIGDEFDYVATPSGGMWSSLASVFATIDPISGHAKAIAVGQTTITYTEPSLCGNTASRILVVLDTISDTITPPPPANINDIDFISSVSLFPNPSTNEVRVEFTMQQSSDLTFEIIDLNGKLLNTQNLSTVSVGQNTILLDISTYANGVYSIILRSEKSLTTKKLVINR